MRALLFASTLLTLALPAEALACSADAPVRHVVAFAASGSVLAHADPERRVVALFDGATVSPAVQARVLVPESAPRGHNPVTAFSPDGSTLLVGTEHYTDETLGAACMATTVRLARVDLRTGTRRVIMTLRSAGLMEIAFSPDGARAVVMVRDEGGEPTVLLLDVARGRRLRTTDDARAWFLDAATLLVADAEGDLRVVRARDGATLATLATPADEERSLLPGATRADRFTLVAERRDAPARLLDVTVRGANATTVPVALTLSGRPLGTSADGARLLVLDGATLRVVDRASGAERFRLTTPYRFTTGAISADGSVVAAVSVAAPEETDSPYDPHAFLPTTIERVMLDADRRAAWGPGARSTRVRAPR